MENRTGGHWCSRHQVFHREDNKYPSCGGGMNNPVESLDRLEQDFIEGGMSMSFGRKHSDWDAMVEALKKMQGERDAAVLRAEGAEKACQDAFERWCRWEDSVLGDSMTPPEKTKFSEFLEEALKK